VWQAATGAGLVGWHMNAADVIGSTAWLPYAPAPWRLVAVADLSGDGRADYVWRHPATTEVIVWVMNAAGTVGMAHAHRALRTHGA
jgi:hypothetical protein